MIEENILKVKLNNSQELDIEVYDIVEVPEKNKKYIVYSVANSENDDVFISILNETENSFSLDTIEDDQELREIEQYLEEINTKDGE